MRDKNEQQGLHISHTVRGISSYCFPDNVVGIFTTIAPMQNLRYFRDAAELNLKFYLRMGTESAIWGIKNIGSGVVWLEK